jgi:hypothetical protein
MERRKFGVRFCLLLLCSRARLISQGALAHKWTWGKRVRWCWLCGGLLPLFLSRFALAIRFFRMARRARGHLYWCCFVRLWLPGSFRQPLCFSPHTPKHFRTPLPRFANDFGSGAKWDGAACYTSLSPLDISPHAAHAALIVFTESSRRKWKTLCEREEYNSPAHYNFIDLLFAPCAHPFAPAACVFLYVTNREFPCRRTVDLNEVKKTAELFFLIRKKWVAHDNWARREWPLGGAVLVMLRQSAWMVMCPPVQADFISAFMLWM